MNQPHDQLSFFEKVNQWMKNSLTLKLVIIGILSLLLMIPNGMIKKLILERSDNHINATREVSDKWGKMQTIGGPVLTIPYTLTIKTKVKDDEYETTYLKQLAHFLPNELNYKTELIPEIRYRGIYEVMLYKTKIKITGDFEAPNFKALGIGDAKINWDDAYLSIGIPDMRGIKERVDINFNDSTYRFNPGIETDQVFSSGISTNIGIKEETDDYLHAFSLDLDINGSEELYFWPLGKETKVDVNSTWSNPSFIGAFLPDSRDINEDGFTASWKILHLNRNFPQSWKNRAMSFQGSAFGLKLFLPVDEYQKNTRSSKYAIMFIVLTFLVFFFVEIIIKRKIHPFQYLLVGLALCVFYILLLSLSEHLGFNIAYLLAAAAIVLLITSYSGSIFKKALPTILTGLIVSILYLFLFTLLQLEGYSLLFGSIGLFIILAVVMFVSRKIDWYNLKGKKTITHE